MTTWSVRNQQDKDNLIKVITHKEMPFSANLTKGAPRTNEQNKLQRKWMLEAEEQGDNSAEDYRAYCKAWFGIPILIAENEAFAAQYNSIVAPLGYEQKIELMKIPIDFPVTRLMSTDQKSRYLNKVYEHFTGLGFQMTLPN